MRKGKFCLSGSVWTWMQRPGELHCCVGRHRAAADLKKPFITPVLSSWFQLTSLTLPLCLSCLSFVHLGRSLGKTSLSVTCYSGGRSQKWAGGGLMQHRSTYRRLSLILHTIMHLTLNTNAHACTHTNNFRRVKVHSEGGWKVEGHFK